MTTTANPRRRGGGRRAAPALVTLPAMRALRAQMAETHLPETFASDADIIEGYLELHPEIRAFGVALHPTGIETYLPDDVDMQRVRRHFRNGHPFGPPYLTYWWDGQHLLECGLGEMVERVEHQRVVVEMETVWPRVMQAAREARAGQPVAHPPVYERVGPLHTWWDEWVEDWHTPAGVTIAVEHARFANPRRSAVFTKRRALALGAMEFDERAHVWVATLRPHFDSDGYNAFTETVFARFIGGEGWRCAADAIAEAFADVLAGEEGLAR